MKKIAVLFLFCATLIAFAAEPTQFTVGGFTFKRPEGWGWVNPSSPMRKAQLSIPEGKGEVTFFHFGPGQGGTVDSNVQRWAGQFQGGADAAKAKTATENYGGVTVTFVTAQGTFNSGMPGQPTTPMENYAMFGAILQDAQNGDVYVKMTGPADAIASATAPFQAMIKAAAEKK